MKILFYLFSSFDHHETSEHLLIAVMEQICIAGHAVHIIQMKTGGNLPLIPYSLSTYEVTTDAIPVTHTSKNKLFSRYITGIRYLIKGTKIIKQDYDAVFIQSTPVAGFAIYMIKKTLPNARITLNIQDIFPYNALFSGKIKNRLLFKLFAIEQRYGYRHCDAIITISEDMKETLVNDGVVAEKIHVIYNWSYQDKPYITKDNSFIASVFNKDYYNIVYAGNIGVMQNVDVIVECANLMKDDKSVWFHIIGDGIYKEKMIQKAKEYGIMNITFSPMQTPESAPAIYSSADINIIPLAENIYKTALPSKIATCLACQRPIIFSIGRNSLFGNMIQKKTDCQVVDANSPQKLAQAILSMKESPRPSQTLDFFKNYCCKKINSKKYADIICDR